ncbi:hypothetical protein L0U88_00995 [Flavihumibacter sp. RY-1]|uniref:LysE type translocator n=1 Tax=Flavihumibacter fluminis TaxID=2909236 RepID=A0ABS9BD45_9BACT|nr:hypothetical protein [Flavihumibacter fluminis]MCF1713200.1 hypothetical protein [Flavihumibacter fluminis]
MAFSQLNKLAAIGNLAFLISFLMRYFPLLQGSVTESMILITGLVVSVALNLAWMVSFVYLGLVKKSRPEINIISILNVIVILVQLYLLLV